MKQETKQILLGGIFNNPIFVLTLGLCPVIAVSTTVENCLFMGAATLLVLVISNTIISALRKVIGPEIRIVAYVLIIATLVTIIQMIVQKFLPGVWDNIGVFISLIVVNCIILGRAEAFAKNNSTYKSALDGLSMGAGYLGALLLIGFVREIFGKNTLTIFGYRNVLGASYQPLGILTTIAGGFLTLAALLMLINCIAILSKRLKLPKMQQKAGK